MSVVEVPPIAGAALLGLDRAGAGPAAERRLRAAYLPLTSQPGEVAQRGSRMLGGEPVVPPERLRRAPG